MSAGLSRSRRATGATSCWGSRCHSTTEQPVIELRNETLLYSIAYLAFTLPLYVT
jgi:hypothetical protein